MKLFDDTNKIYNTYCYNALKQLNPELLHKLVNFLEVIKDYNNTYYGIEVRDVPNQESADVLRFFLGIFLYDSYTYESNMPSKNIVKLTTLSEFPKEIAEKLGHKLKVFSWNNSNVISGSKLDGVFVEDLGDRVSLEMVLIPSGKFMMGSPINEKNRSNDESPQHQVEISKPFYMGRFLVTQRQWQQIMGNNPSDFKNGDLFPVENVSWNDCQEFIEKLNAKTGKTYRLPSEAEWEYACRAGTETPFYFGETISTEVANYDGDYTYGNGQKGEYREQTTQVGSFPANGFGLYDMHGNLWEWCEDDWEENYNEPRTQKAYIGLKVLRGGSWFHDPRYCRSATRDGYVAVNSSFYRGFRLALPV